jgi:hypothetical protein
MLAAQRTRSYYERVHNRAATHNMDHHRTGRDSWNDGVAARRILTRCGSIPSPAPETLPAGATRSTPPPAAGSGCAGPEAVVP